MNDRVAIWQAAKQGGLAACSTGNAARLSAAGCSELDQHACGPSVVITPLSHPNAGAIGALLVGGGGCHVALNGIILTTGLHALRHADHIEIDQRSFWVSRETSVEEVPYDPVTHGDDVYCLLTKARFPPGHAIVICPGVSGDSCGAIFTAAAWQMAMQSGMRCPRCGFRSGQRAGHHPKHVATTEKASMSCLPLFTAPDAPAPQGDDRYSRLRRTCTFRARWHGPLVQGVAGRHWRRHVGLARCDGSGAIRCGSRRSL